MSRATVLTASLALIAGSAFAGDGKPVLAIAEVRVSTPAAQLQFSEDGVRDVLTAALKGIDAIDVMDWNRLADVAFRCNLASSDLVPSRKTSSRPRTARPATCC